MKFCCTILALICALIAVSAHELRTKATTCEEYSDNKDMCLKSMEQDVPCSYCSSAAVGGLCAPETDTKDLPPSVFACDYQQPKPLKSGSTCDSFSSDKDQCLQSEEEGVPCAYCNSAAVGGLCAPETDAKGLPPSVFACEYQASAKSYNPYKTGLPYRKPLGSTCTGPHEFCCEAPGGDPNNCPDSARTTDCDAQGSCCCA